MLRVMVVKGCPHHDGFERGSHGHGSGVILHINTIFGRSDIRRQVIQIIREI
jgi:hypothetical protein